VIGETARRALPEDVQRMRSAVYRVLSGRAEPSELVQAAHSPPPTVDPAREELRRKLLAVTVQPAAPAEPAPAERPEPERAVNGKPALAADAKPARAENPPAAAPAATPDLAELVDAVADTVVTKLKGEIEAAMDLAIGTRESEILTRIRALDDRLAVVYRMLTELRGTDPPEARHAEELERLRTENELLWEEYGEADAIARKQAARIRWLERRLAEAGQQVHGVTGEDVFEPEGMREMLDHARKSLTHVVIGDTDEAAARLDLDYPEQRRTWAAKAWDALCALEDFARARSSGEFAGGFYDWCANGPAGRRTISTRMIAMRESRTVVTRAKFSEPRTFRVPESVAPGGQVMMEAHIKLRPVGYPAPRSTSTTTRAGRPARSTSATSATTCPTRGPTEAARRAATAAGGPLRRARPPRGPFDRSRQGSGPGRACTARGGPCERGRQRGAGPPRPAPPPRRAGCGAAAPVRAGT